jgi:ABC-type multidrug transport system fused ATPase/permease subunit
MLTVKLAAMESSIFRFVLRYSRKEQILLLLVTFSAFPFLYISLDLPKTIINEAIGGKDFPQELFGQPLEQVPYLLTLCGAFLVLVFINGGFKYAINVYRGVVGERMLRRLRYQLFERVLRFPMPQFRKLSQGEIISMVTAETADIGGYHVRPGRGAGDGGHCPVSDTGVADSQAAAQGKRAEEAACSQGSKTVRENR